MHYERTATHFAWEEETVADLFAATTPASLALVCDCTRFSEWEILTALD